MAVRGLEVVPRLSRMLKNNITHFSFKQQWQTTLHALENVNVANMFGETAGMSIALNSNSPGSVEYGMESGHGHNERQCAYLPCQPVPR